MNGETKATLPQARKGCGGGVRASGGRLVLAFAVIAAATCLATQAVALEATAASDTMQGSPQADEARVEEVEALIEAGRYAEAEAAGQSLLAGMEASGSAESLVGARLLSALVEAMRRPETGALPEARDLAERALVIRQRVLGAEHPDVAASLNLLALLSRDGGNVEEARHFHERVIAILERSKGPNDPGLAVALGNLANVQRTAGEHSAAKAGYERALAILEHAPAADPLDIATVLSNLAGLLRDMGDFPAARTAFERALAIYEETLGRDHPDVAIILNNLANLLHATGDLTGARQHHEKALAIYEAAYGSDSRFVARSLGNLAVLLTEMGDLATARRLQERALAMQLRLGKDHPDVALNTGGLALVLEKLGDLATARHFYEQALALREATLGPEHVDVARALNNLATLLHDMGDVAAARPLLERGLAIREKALGPDHPSTAVAVNNLARLLQDTGDLAAAQPLFERALATWEKTLGPAHPAVGSVLNNMGGLHRDAGNFREARDFLTRSLVVREAKLGTEHADVATTLQHLGNVARALGDHGGAQAYFERALTIRETGLGPEHPLVAMSLGDLAAALADRGEIDAALDAALRAETIGRAHARLTSSALAERQALRYASVRPTGLDVALSLASHGGNPAAAARTLDAVIRSRALVLDEMMARHRPSTTSEERELAEAWRSARQRLANLTIRGPRDETIDVHRKLLAAASEESERAERALAESSAAFRDERSRSSIGLADVARGLRPGEALVSTCRFHRHPVGWASRDGDGSAAERPSPVPTYLAFVLREGQREPRVVELGRADEIDDLVASWRERVSVPSSLPELFAAGDALRRRTWDPIAPLLGDVARVVLVPDGSLNLVAFAALPTGDGRYLVEDGPLMQHLSAERDLVPTSRSRREGGAILVLGDPHFDEISPSVSVAPERDAPALARLVTTGAAAFRGNHSACGDFAALRFAALDGARREAREVATTWRRHGASVVHLSGPDATEAAFRSMAPRSRVVHVATHGFFLGGSCPSALGATRGAAAVKDSTLEAERPEPGENPLVLTGLALAGANRREVAGPDEDDGILTAEEIASLDLTSVDWAVLSACDTGLGEVAAGEGVFGLRRAFQVAGARTLVMSLWAVGDEDTRRFMRTLYVTRTSRGLDAAECVRLASLSILGARRESGQSTHPFHWAAFVAAGEAS